MRMRFVRNTILAQEIASVLPDFNDAVEEGHRRDPEIPMETVAESVGQACATSMGLSPLALLLVSI